MPPTALTRNHRVTRPPGEASGYRTGGADPRLRSQLPSSLFPSVGSSLPPGMRPHRARVAEHVKGSDDRASEPGGR